MDCLPAQFKELQERVVIGTLRVNKTPSPMAVISNADIT
jgi:hypothetical protein